MQRVSLSSNTLFDDDGINSCFDLSVFKAAIVPAAVALSTVYELSESSSSSSPARSPVAPTPPSLLASSRPSYTTRRRSSTSSISSSATFSSPASSMISIPLPSPPQLQLNSVHVVAGTSFFSSSTHEEEGSEGGYMADEDEDVTSSCHSSKTDSQPRATKPSSSTLARRTPRRAPPPNESWSTSNNSYDLDFDLSSPESFHPNHPRVRSQLVYQSTSPPFCSCTTPLSEDSTTSNVDSEEEGEATTTVIKSRWLLARGRFLEAIEDRRLEESVRVRRRPPLVQKHGQTSHT